MIKVDPPHSISVQLTLQTATSVWPYLDWDRERADVDGFIEGGATLFERRSYKQAEVNLLTLISWTSSVFRISRLSSLLTFPSTLY